jgi:Mg-chelatase subunit ChlD
MVKATKDRKAEANSFADSRVPQGATNIYDALMKAFAMAGRGSHDDAYGVAVDTIFLLTDGQPTAGAIVQPGSILDEVRRINRLRRIKIHCIGIGDTDTSFLRTLAAESGGTYVAK